MSDGDRQSRNFFAIVGRQPAIAEHLSPLHKKMSERDFTILSPQAERGFSSKNHFVHEALDEVTLYQSERTGGFCSILTRHPFDDFHQTSFPIGELATHLQDLDINIDQWVSQATFFSAYRRSVNMHSVGLSFLDIDCYEHDWAQGRTPEQLADSFNYFCDDEGVPRPSLTVFSGRGIQVKWLYERRLPRMALGRWNVLQKSLCKKFEKFGADSHAKDISRVLRIVGTRNCKNNQICRVCGVSLNDDGLPQRYDFENFFENVAPFNRDEIHEIWRQAKERRKNRRPPKEYTTKTLNWSRLEDLRTLLRLRGGIEEGHRMIFLMYLMNYLALSGQVSPDSFYAEAELLAAEVDPNWNFEKGALSTLFNKYQQHKEGELAQFDERTAVVLYTPTSQTLIDVLKITDAEMAHLSTIVTDDERRRRNRAKKESARRQAGVLSRAEYEARARERQEQARILKREGLSLRQIAARMSLSRTQIQRYLECSTQVSHVCHVI